MVVRIGCRAAGIQRRPASLVGGKGADGRGDFRELPCQGGEERGYIRGTAKLAAQGCCPAQRQVDLRHQGELVPRRCF